MLICDQQQRAWPDSIPQVAFGADGQTVAAYGTKNVAICYYVDQTGQAAQHARRADLVDGALGYVRARVAMTDDRR